MNETDELYNIEIETTLEGLRKGNDSFRTFNYYEDLAFQYLNADACNREIPQVVVLGRGVPEVLLSAFGIRYRYLLGGSRLAATLSDDLVPRDTDPISRSILGELLLPGRSALTQALFIIPIHSDSFRKIAYLMKEKGYKTFTLDIPPDHSNKRSLSAWEEQLIMMTDAISKHTGKYLSMRKLTKALRSVALLRYQLNTFLSNSCKSYHDISGAGKMFLRNCYYYENDPKRWKYHINALNKEVFGTVSGDGGQNRPRVLLTGSPVIFPNYKIPFLIEEVGLTIADYIDESTIAQNEIFTPGRSVTLKQAIREIAESSYRYAASSSFTNNVALMSAIHNSIKSGRIEGVIFHILKGQIEYDFELERMTEMFEYYDIPVFRLETDFQQQDIEQLRIRLEAFREMLSQFHYSSAKKAV